MNILKTSCVSLALAVGLAACAAPSQPYLDNARTLCAGGDQTSCGQVPQFQAQVNAEHADQAGKVALGILGGLALVAGAAAAGYSAAHPVYDPPVVVVCRWNCW